MVMNLVLALWSKVFIVPGVIWVRVALLLRPCHSFVIHRKKTNQMVNSRTYDDFVVYIYRFHLI